MAAADTTPMMRQYRRIKQKQGDAILFFRLGDFYEMFEGDAKRASSMLNLTLTSRNGVPMCGIPYHAAQSYIARLLDAGQKIAVCEQTSMPEGGKGIAEREVVQVITPGTVVDEDYLDRSSNNYLVSIGEGRGRVSIASVDLSTGELQATSYATEARLEGVRREIQRLAPREILIQESLMESDHAVGRYLSDINGIMINRFPDWDFDVETSTEKLQSQLGVTNLKGFGLPVDGGESIRAVGVLLDYVADTQRTLLPHINDIDIYEESEFVGLDETTQRNLELVRNIADGGKKYTLLQVLDFTRTSMGARMLKKWLLNPLTDLTGISHRADAVERIYRNQLYLSSLREALSSILDLERLAARVALDRAHAKDLLAIRSALAGCIEVDRLSAEWLSLPDLEPDDLNTAAELGEFLEHAVHPEPSILLTEGRLIADGYSPELDRLRSMRSNSRAVLDEYLESEKAQSGIQNLKIKYNKIIGYYLEVTKSNLDSVPRHFIRRQSLVGSERYTTDRLADLETELNGTTDRIVGLERELFLEIRKRVRERITLLKRLAGSIAQIDCLQSFAYAATVHGYTRPEMDDSDTIGIVQGRHPVVEAHLASGEFVPNDTTLGGSAVPFALITGPNMAGKSTYLRQVALIVLMAHIGSFVPAQEARIGLVDRIFCRVGAQDNLARGESTFLVEMNETAHILRTMTQKSLIIMDEVGRGTGTNDGLSIAQAVTEYLIASGTKTLFATHFHELTAIEDNGKINLALEVLEHDDEVIFLKHVRPGAVDHSYGIHVARLAGIPATVVDRARNILADLLASAPGTERSKRAETTGSSEPPADGARKKPIGENQSGLFEEFDLIKSEIASIDIGRTTPLAALEAIDRWQRLLKQ